ncbi:metallophosphoesterase family protein [Stenotrophomonas sp. 24(2023)]|uniref:purple acid phosphatase family protein n=1 Tax=Stenotrophomonas sp. 24(2023) TaxID=3068324 RepID=UPI0027DF82D1|nr:metallophosphoesterase family protein [Stenotrophomonas sp. 24(2023)]WMJ68787.1 metallophosphoesterase family protein [Stenotrophomonas sp. 24(2023)]
MRGVRMAALALGLACLFGSTAALAATAGVVAEPNTQVPAGNRHYAASGFPDRIVASPSADPRHGFAVAWRTDASVQAPLLEIAIAGDSPAIGPVTRITASTRTLQSENGLSHHHRADITGLQPGTLYVYRVQGKDTWGAWNQLRTAGEAGTPLTVLYFGDTQNKNLSHVSRVIRAGQKAAPGATLSLFAGDLVSGGDHADDSEWGEWFAAAGWLAQETLVAPAIGNHEYFEEFEDTPQERRVLGRHWPVTFALPGNGAGSVASTTYWFDQQGVRFVVLDGTSALDLGTAQAQAGWLDQVLSGNPNPWTIVLLHQPFYSPREGRENTALREVLLPVLRRHAVDLVLQGHDHTYGRRGEGNAATPQFVVTVAGPKQYRLSGQARRTMDPVAEDTQLFQVLDIDGQRLRYQARTVTGQLYDGFELVRGADGRKQKVELTQGRIAPRDCQRAQTLKGRADRCWE